MFQTTRTILLLICLPVLFASFVGAQKKQSSNQLYVGCWGGTHGGLLRISSNKIYDFIEDRKFSYKELSKPNEKDDKYFLELTSKPRNSFIKKIIVIKFLKKDDMAFFGYDSFQDYQDNKPFTGMGEFFKQDCKTTK